MANEITLPRGNTDNITITVRDSTGTVFPLTGFEMWCTVKKNKNDLDTVAILQKECVIASPSTGIGVLSLTTANTDITPGQYYYDVKIFNADNSIVKTVILPTTFTIIQDITQKDGGV